MSSKWRPLTTGLLISGLVLILVALVGSYVVTNFQPKVEVRLGSNVFKVRTAETEESREKGLSGVSHLEEGNGLLMVFDKDDTWGIWMKEMKFPIDIVWLDSNKKVVHIVTDASPDLSTTETFTPKKPARYVLELPAGSVQASAIKINDTASFTLGSE